MATLRLCWVCRKHHAPTDYCEPELTDHPIPLAQVREEFDRIRAAAAEEARQNA